ncbi:Seleno U [Micractinium conductrix]|uniref:Seleno U n=1 Tax=Micractinium conductrix TaxID=554055 RepID=A0A2P6VFR5_9CHLO|nr:Seleno U [Micractinium conductrix]|eukprot:PSC72932.1 Seleno U [Micractinium conductrix]
MPPVRLLADPENACYDALSGTFKKGLRATFFNAATPAAIKARQESGADADLKAVLKSYKPLMPKRGDQAFWQGGALVFEGQQAPPPTQTSRHFSL